MRVCPVMMVRPVMMVCPTMMMVVPLGHHVPVPEKVVQHTANWNCMLHLVCDPVRLTGR